ALFLPPACLPTTAYAFCCIERWGQGTSADPHLRGGHSHSYALVHGTQTCPFVWDKDEPFGPYAKWTKIMLASRTTPSAIPGAKKYPVSALYPRIAFPRESTHCWDTGSVNNWVGMSFP